MKHFHRLVLVGATILVLYLIKQQFDSKKKEGFLSTGETLGIVIPVIIISFIGIIFWIYKDSKKWNNGLL